MNCRRIFALAPLALSAALAVMPAHAQDAAALRAATETALGSNPEVSSRLHAFQAANDGLAAARGARGPTLDLNGSIGRERATYDAGVQGTSFNRTGLGLELSQVLWDGRGTAHAVDRADYERRARHFELLDATEQVALDAVTALYDLHRYQRLVALGEDSLAQHRAAAEKIGSRVKAGVGRGVDLEQANARVALSESNLNTDRSNLHDVQVRYRRIVGTAAPAVAASTAPPMLLVDQVPGAASMALALGLSSNLSIQASIEAIAAAQAAVRVQSAGLQPRVEVRVRSGSGYNYNGLEGRRSDSAAEVLLNWNLFDGGAERSRVRQREGVLAQAMDRRDQACRDVGQTLTIAYNDTVRLGEQVTLLERNTTAIERARDAYRQQFDIGQRSLLDLLNAENEALIARRALANAEYDRALAYARVHAAMSQLNARLGLARPATMQESTAWSERQDGAMACPLPVASASPRR